MALVSIVMPTYNSAAYILEAVDSVLSQTFTDWELEIVDDCGTDNTLELLQPYLDKHHNIHYSCMEKNGGPAAARTAGIAKASGKYIAFLDSDDKWCPEKLETQLSLHEKTGVDLSYTGARCVDSKGCLTDRYFIVPESHNYSSLLKGNDIVCSSVVVKKSVIELFPMVRSDLHEDYICWLSLLKSGYTAAGINEALVLYRLTANSKSRSKLKSAKMTYQVYKYMGLPLFKRCFAFVNYAVHGFIRYYK